MATPHPGLSLPAMPFRFSGVAGSRPAWSRLCAATGLSVLLHIAVMIGLPINPTGGVPGAGPALSVRLEPGEVLAQGAELQPVVPEPLLEPVAPVLPPERTAAPEAPQKPLVSEARSAVPAASPSTGLEVPLIRDPTFYSASQLDVYPAPLVPVRPDCPEHATTQRIEGRVRLLILLDEFGLVSDVSVVEAQPGGYFEEITLAAFRPARFSPAQKDGRAVKSRLAFTVRFICHDPARR